MGAGYVIGTFLAPRPTPASPNRAEVQPDGPTQANQGHGAAEQNAPFCVVDEQLIQAHKLAAFGQLSTGVAHEINNPLAIINEEAGWLEDLLAKEESRDFTYRGEFTESLRIIIKQTHRCGDITGKLLRFAENMDSNIREVDLNELLDEVVGILEKDAALRSIVIERDFDANLSKMYSDSAQLRQLVLNLINNALDAVERDGTVVVGTRSKGADWVVITVKDDGCGIPEDHLHRLFEPFFTTKPPGKGAGLGLSICYGIATKLGGVISVDSAVAKGSTFTVTLPLRAPGPEMIG
ncbi:sensor histidine kinase [Desulfonatronum thioautotrophicum]|uniref:sensor histidine kinase n=1 Tax=Desulfonatronum thioautotrophicum TaxID=617001 RepID=UPI00069AC55E|nr:ATP-binding protein [Desulfonatronum thioautotrophicum]